MGRCLQRKAVLRLLAAASTCRVSQEAAQARVAQAGFLPRQELTLLPLKRCGGAYCTEYYVEGQRFRAVADTGSPFLLVSGPDRVGECAPFARWGCLSTPGASVAMGDASLEGFGGQDMGVEWRRGTLNIGDFAFAPVNFGVVRSSVGLGGTQAIYLGLVRDRQPRVRPTLLEQTDVRALQFDFPRERMILARRPLLTRQDAIPLVDLRRLGAPIAQYACIVSQLVVNGEPVPLSRPCVAVIDTGTTGLVISDSLYDSDELPLPGAAIRDISVVAMTERGQPISFHASSRRRTTADDSRGDTGRGSARRLAGEAPDGSADFPLIATPVSLPWFRLGAPDALGAVVGDGPLLPPGGPTAIPLSSGSGISDPANNADASAAGSAGGSAGSSSASSWRSTYVAGTGQGRPGDARRARMRYAKLAARGMEGEAAEPHVLFLGLAFLNQMQITVDIDEMRMLAVKSGAAGR
eukprot:scaffold13666_cov109-Isochrysis_galbana.AAC.1